MTFNIQISDTKKCVLKYFRVWYRYTFQLKRTQLSRHESNSCRKSNPTNYRLEREDWWIKKNLRLNTLRV